MKLELLKYELCVCKLDSLATVDIQSDFFFLAKTESELSLVCKEMDAPRSCAKVERGWRAMRIVGALDFALVGILSRIANALADRGIPIFAVSTYDTDYILVKDEYVDRATATLDEKGYEIC